jgi:cytochrome P450
MDYDINDTSPGLEHEHVALTWLRAHDPVHWDRTNEAWLLTRQAEIREVLRRPRTWSSARGLFPPRHMNAARSSIITMDDPEHASYRKLISRAFTPAMLRRQVSRLRGSMDDAIDAIADRRTCDFVASLAVEECLRWASTVRGLKRTALEGTELAGQKVRSGEQVVLLYPSANRDEAVFEQPFEFRVTRDPNPHLAFGEGSHYCLGANLARLEIRIALEQILARLPGLRLAPRAAPTPRLSALANGVERMQVAFDSVSPRH